MLPLNETPLLPEHKLLRKMLVLAGCDLLQPANETPEQIRARRAPPTRLLKADARMWFFYGDPLEEFSVHYVCDGLGLDVKKVQQVFWYLYRDAPDAERERVRDLLTNILSA